MEDMNNRYSLNDFDSKDIVSFDSRLFKVEQLTEALKNAFNSRYVGPYLYEALAQQNVPIDTRSFSDAYREESNEWWFSEGGNCEVLRPGPQGWQKGKIRIRVKVDLEFCPDETENDQTESTLDDIRQMINE
uniref:KGK domain-containing protein n=1 Tax=Trichocoleus desertorum TaxID=1481672 RepID=UPI0025B3B072|nr:KGK domain-containing protein [Trichocoleus desertorum]